MLWPNLNPENIACKIDSAPKAAPAFSLRPCKDQSDNFVHPAVMATGTGLIHSMLKPRTTNIVPYDLRNWLAFKTSGHSILRPDASATSFKSLHFDNPPGISLLNPSPQSSFVRDMNLLDELRWRGMIHNEEGLMPGTAEFLADNKTSGYIGFDPTGPSLHIGSLATVMLLVHFQRAGHTPIALVGGATGMVGDPSGKDKERSLLTKEEIDVNLSGIRAQLEHFLDFGAADNPAEVVNNYDWFENIGFIEFLRDVGKHISINYMTSKESVKKRLESDTGISYTEFAYQLLQGYDFYWLHQNKNVRIQMGGSDQWGNITTGNELIRKMAGHEAEAFAITCPLITREDGSKFGKTADGESVWLDPEMTSPYTFYQYWLNVSDQDAVTYIKVFTLLDRQTIEGLIASHEGAEHERKLQLALAEDVTRRVHGQAELDKAKALTAFLFARTLDRQTLDDLSPDMWKDIAADSPDTLSLETARLTEGLGILDALTDLGITASKGEARRSITKDNSVSINGEKCSDPERVLGASDAFHGSFLLIQRGKKNRYIVQVG